MIYKVICNNQDITELITSMTSSIEFEEGTPLIGNAPSLKFELSIDNTSQLINDLLDYPFEIYRNDDLLATLNVYEKPELTYAQLDLELYDNLVKTNIPYETNTQMYPCTVQNQLDEMKSLTGLNIDYSQLDDSVLSKTINEYDNSITIRVWLCMIAESGACNIFCKPNGDIYFKPISKEVIHTINNDNYVYTFQKNYEFNCTMVLCELLNLYKGNETGNIVKTTENNPYITTQEDINFIFSKIGGLSFTSIKELKTRAIDDLTLGELTEYTGYFNFIARRIETTYYNGSLAHDVITIDGDINSSQKSSFVGDNNLSAKYRRLKIIVDEDNKKIGLLAEQQEKNTTNIGKLEVSIDSINSEVSKVTNSIYKFESGSGNIFLNCYQYLRKVSSETGVKYIDDMPLDINMDFMRGKDICISCDILVQKGIIGNLGNYLGAEFEIGYADGTKKKYYARWYLGQYNLQYLLQTSTVDHEERIWLHYKIDDKEIASVSNLKMIIAMDCEQAIVANPKVEFGTYPTGFEFDLNYVRDNVETIQRDYTEIKQEVSTLTLKSVSMEEEITTIKGDVSSVTTRLQSAEIKLQPTNILLAVNEQIGADGTLHTTKFVLDKNGVHISGGGLDISNNAGTKVLYADTSGNLVINNLTANNGDFSGVVNATSGTFYGTVYANAGSFKGSIDATDGIFRGTVYATAGTFTGSISGSTITGGNINGTTINTDKDLTVGNNIYVGSYGDRNTKKHIYFNDRYCVASRNDVGYFGLVGDDGLFHNGTINITTTGSIYAVGSGYIRLECNENTSIMLSNGSISMSHQPSYGSDIRLKTEFKNINLISVFDKIDICSYKYKTSDQRQVGVIAQHFIGNKYEEYILSKDSNGYYAVNYNTLYLSNIQKTKALEKEIKSLRNEILLLKSKLGGIYYGFEN